MRLKIVLVFLLFLTSCATLDFHLPQDKKNNCGQTCVAYITGASVRDIELFLDTDGVTTPQQLEKALRHFGARCKDFEYYSEKLPNYALVLVKLPKEYHWIVWKHGKYWDPILPIKYTRLKSSTKIMLFIEIIKS